ncbi:aminotransferase class V-fold PLP-dependent enzyme [Candidatus Poriferisocius sp.]|uniref:aminotransferase class V-fold PLP-dependent enzyme n=1 Tax=Candidatus Poriferisocius sp. TaxID=3101276 RepID=UPI003B59A16D
MNEVYLDYNGSAPLDPRVSEAMVPVLLDGVGNASASHRFGQRQAALVETAREQVAALVGAAASGVVFCAGATEANNLALAGLAAGAPAARNRVVVSAVEHASVAR